MTVQEIQAILTPDEDLSAYAGRWVALRNGRVVAVGDHPVAVRDLDEVAATDAIVPVPDPKSGILVL